jgi:hypothetical protein
MYVDGPHISVTGYGRFTVVPVLRILHKGASYVQAF